MYWVDTPSSASNWKSCLRAKCVISSPLIRTPSHVVYRAEVSGSPLIWQRRMPPVFRTRRASARYPNTTSRLGMC